MNRQIKTRIAAVGLAAVLGAGLAMSYGAGRNRSCTKRFFAMDTYMEITAYGRESERAVEEAVREVQRLDELWSTGAASSEVSRINASGGGELSEDTVRLLERAQDICRETGGLFDFTVYPLMRLWGFPTQEYHVPTEEELEEVLPLVDASRVCLDGAEVSLGEGQQIDLGGIAKGYTSARIMDIFRADGIASGMVSLGGNVQVIGRKTDGSRWQVGIQDPDSAQGEVLAVVEAEDQAVITSGGYERYFEEDGNTYIHILDPRTGYPADGNLKSVTVVSADGTLADALSTSLYIMGYEQAVRFWRSHRTEFDMVLVTEEGELCVTKGLESRIRSNREYVVVSEEEG